MILVWRDEFAVGVAEIDAQHRRLIDMVAAFYGALAEGKQAKDALGELLKRLLDYTRYHFSTEERLMQQAEFPATSLHQAQHAVFVAKITDMVARLAEGRLVLSVEATVFIQDWLVDHILVTDKRLGRYLTSHGVS
jgi:hemerythrin